MNRVVITGIGIVAPIGCGVDPFLNALKTGKNGIQFIPKLKELNFGCQIGGIPDYSTSVYHNYISKYNLTDASDIIKLAIIAGLESWENAGLVIPEFGEGNTDYDTGIIIGSGIGSVDIFGDKIIPQTNAGEIKKLRSTIVEHSMLSGPGANLAGILACGNQVSFNSSACSTGVEAIIMGSERIKSGKAKRMIVGGVDVYSPFAWSGFDSMRVLNRKNNDSPEKGSRPMSASASGFVPGAGCGILILEDREQALERNANIYCEIAGEFINCGGQRNGGTMTAPNSNGVIKCIQGALMSGNIKSEQIDFISGHLSSTMADPIEVANWSKALNRKGAHFPYINSLKSLTGHCIGAAGAIETIAAVLQMKHSFLHKSANSEDLHPDISETIDINKIPQETINNLNINYIAKASFGFGDVNACLILKK